MLVNILVEIRTLRTLLLLLYCLLCKAGDETVALQEVEGTNITLHTGITGIQSDAQILWFYGPEKAEEKTLISQVFKGETVTEISERFKERLQLDRVSGALTIRNISRNLSGVYLLQIIITGRLSSKTFSFHVYASVSAPVIRKERAKGSVLSTESCSLLCTVDNGEDVTLSWYRENERISNTSNTDLSVPLHLPLQIQHPDNNTNSYNCVSANPANNKTTSLDLTHLCHHHHSGYDRSRSLLPLLISTGVFLFLVTSIPVWVCRKRINKFLNKFEEMTHTEVEITAHSSDRVKKEGNSRITDDQDVCATVFSSVVTRLI